MDPITLSGAAIALLIPYATEFGKGAANAIGEEAAKAAEKLLANLRAKLDENGQTALERVIEVPESASRQNDLHKYLVKALKADPTFETELKAILPAAVQDNDIMAQNVSGTSAKAVQVKGKHNKTMMS